MAALRMSPALRLTKGQDRDRRKIRHFYTVRWEIVIPRGQRAEIAGRTPSTAERAELAEALKP
jgi:hypothetical protein